MTESEKWYDEVLAPQLLALSEEALNRGVNLVAAVEYAPGETAHTAGVNPGACFALQLSLNAAKCAGNVDLLLMWLVRRARELPPEKNQSAALQILLGALPR